MRIGIDARFYGSIGKGLGRYTERLVSELERIVPADSVDEFVVFLRKENFHEYIPNHPKFRKVLADFSWYGFREQLLFPILIRRHCIDLIHFPHFNVPIFCRRRFVVTIHDLILLRYPTVRNTTLNALWYRIKFAAYRFTIASAVRRAKTILTVSEFTKRDLVAEYPGAAGKIVVAYEGCDIGEVGMLVSGQESPRHGILSPYFLYVGNAYPHKNLEIFIPVAKQFPDVQFVLVGKEDFFYRRLRDGVEQTQVRNIIFPGFIPDEELVSLYRGAVGYVFPSLYEGFGLPPLEAMRLGTPVIASSRGSLPEVLGDAALFFDPEKEMELVSHLQALLSDASLRRALSVHGEARAARFSWTETAEAALSAYHR